jgi:hypothetical protein
MVCEEQVGDHSAFMLVKARRVKGNSPKIQKVKQK